MQGERHNFDFKELGAVCQADNWCMWKRKYGDSGQFPALASAGATANRVLHAVDYAPAMGEGAGTWIGA